jgi:hypothetical protein
VENIPTISTNVKVFSLEDIEFGVKKLAKENAKDIESYQTKILKIGRHVLIPYIHKIFNSTIKQGFPKTWNQCLIIPIFIRGNKNNL